jgi:hypothetical protein
VRCPENHGLGQQHLVEVAPIRRSSLWLISPDSTKRICMKAIWHYLKGLFWGEEGMPLHGKIALPLVAVGVALPCPGSPATPARSRSAAAGIPPLGNSETPS